MSYISLENFRNYGHLALELPERTLVFQGANAQGKTNLLEAIFLLATARSPRATLERELIGLGSSSPAQVKARVQRRDGELKVEFSLQAGSEPPGEPGAEDSVIGGGVRKLVRLNGLPRRLGDVVGQVRAVMFTAQDIELVGGPPALRRRYLDLALSQVDRRYLTTLQRYQRVLQQRNGLLRRLGEGESQWSEVDFWDRELVELGSWLTHRRGEMIETLQERILPIYSQLSGGQVLQLVYTPSIGREHPQADLPVLVEDFYKMLRDNRAREIAAGMTLGGPHRDDVQFLVQGLNMGVYGSRGQRRTIALALRLAEASFLADRGGEPPLLLLDDLLSELDRERRELVLASLESYPQVFITATDWELFPSPFLARAVRFQIVSGAVYPGD